MFKNLDAEQARWGHSNQFVADELAISRTTYEKKKKSGNFKLPEAKKLCKLYNCKFEYLFATDDDFKIA